MKIFEPKPPPTSGAITRSLCSGAMPMNAEMTSRATCGFCVVFHSVNAPVPESYSPIAARGSMAFGTSRLLMMSSLVTWLADLNAASTAFGIAEMPLIDRVARRDFVDLCGAPAFCAAAGSATAGSTAYSTLTFSAASRACASVSAIDHRDRIADIAGLAVASAGCGAIFIGEPSLEWIIQPQMRLPILSAGKLGAGEDRDDAGHAEQRLWYRSI